MVRNQVLEAFSFLFEDFGFVFSDAPVEYEEISIIAESGSIRLRFIQDRSDFFIDVFYANNPENWVGLYDVLDQMKQKGRISEGYKYINRIGALSALLKKFYPQLQAYVLSEN